MKTATFIEGVFVALVSSFIGSVAYYILSSLFADSVVIRLIISGISFAYILYLLTRSNERLGRITVITLWSIITIITWFFWPSTIVFILIHLGSIWLVRSLYFYSSLFSSLADLCLNVVSIAITFWTASYTGSLFLTLWCFFLIQALFVMIPTSIKPSTHTTSSNLNNEADFQRAYRIAQSVVRKLSTNQ
jgi:hypothetical protein